MTADAHDQAQMCMGCGLAGVIPPERFPQPPGLSSPCVTCGSQSVWVSEPYPKRDNVHPATAVEDYLSEVMKRGNRRARGASQ